VIDSPREPSEAPFPYADYVRASEALRTALAGPPCYAVLSAASGMGKSTLLRGVVESLEGRTWVYLSSSRASITNIVRYLARILRVPAKRSNLETLDEIAKSIRSQQPPRPAVVLVDEADRLTADTLQEFRMIAECELQSEPLFSVVLSGLPSVSELLDTPIAFPLKRRIGVRCSLGGLRRDELVPFLEHRFGGDMRRVPPAAHDELFERTQAAPGLVDRILRSALAHTPGRLSPDHVHAALDQAGV
jgi:type II secretory pathway predicted ATPase ExeA